jgi:LysR family transcriptional regulator for metE and metH
VELEIRHLKTLVSLHKTGSLVAAAEQLNLSQSALSHQLKVLEDYLGTPVLLRKTRPMRFTPAGQKLLELADKILPLVTQTEQQLSRIKIGDSGRLHIGVECHSCFDWLMPTLDQYRLNWPDVELDLSTGFDFNPAESLLRTNTDLIITSDIRHRSDIAYVPLMKYQLLLAVSSKHPLASEPCIYPEDMYDDIVITYPVERERLDIFTHFLSPADVEPSLVRHSQVNAMTLQLVASNRGVAALPCWVVSKEVCRHYDIKALSLGESGIWGTLFAAIRQDDAKRSYFQGFIELARETINTRLEGIMPVDAPAS